MSPQGEKLRIGWPAFWLGQLRRTATQIHEDASTLGAVFKGAIGACVMADYVTRVESSSDRAVACLVHGSADSVVVAAVQVSEWAQLGPQLELAISSYQMKS
jgi:hypothetical protein